MILLALLIGAVGVILANFWQEIKSWLGRVLTKVVEIIKRAIVGFKVFLKKINQTIQQISKMYSRDEKGIWNVSVSTTVVDENDVPEEVRAKLKNSKGEVDISNELTLQLGG
jgi:rhamnogalacturonyl hydrolase YesR